MYASGFKQQEQEHVVLRSGDFPQVSKVVTIKRTSETFVIGTVMGQVTVSKKYVPAVAAAEDGSQTPEAILAETVSGEAGDRKAVVYLTGEFRAGALTFGAGHTADTARAGLRDKSIFI